MNIFKDIRFKKNHSKDSHNEYYGKLRVGKKLKSKKSLSKKTKYNKKQKGSGKKRSRK